MTVHEMIDTHPESPSFDREAVARCIEECFHCAVTCTSCADACLGEETVYDLVRCIRLNLDCADTCEMTGHMLIRQTAAEPQVVRAALEACAEACRACGEECERHAGHHEHCRLCAEACRTCERSCRELLEAVPSVSA
jgi:hypothetical protein